MVQVCVIGAGPSGLSTLAAFNKLAKEGHEVEVTCYDKQAIIGGMWNVNWRQGLDEHQEPLHNSMYRDLFSNSPKETVEYPDYTFNDHFGKNIPSCPPRAVMIDYMLGYMKKRGVSADMVKLSHCVKNVSYNEEKKRWSVKVVDLKNDVAKTRKFDYLVVATSHFSVPNFPTFEGIETFNGTVLHVHNFRNGRQFAGQRVLLIGASYSAEDLTLQLLKFGASHVTQSYRTRPMPYAGFPDNVNSVPLLSRIADKRCHFIDGSSAQYDTIILCTGYQVSFPFLPSEMSLKCGNTISPPNLYRGVQWVPSDGNRADGRLFYLGMQDLCYSYTMFIVQAEWAAKVITGLVVPPSLEEKLADNKHMDERNASIASVGDAIDLQTDQVMLLAKDINYPHNLDIGYMLKAWAVHKMNNIMTYRDQVYESKFTKEVSPAHPEPFMKQYDDSLSGYLSNFQ